MSTVPLSGQVIDSTLLVRLASIVNALESGDSESIPLDPLIAILAAIPGVASVRGLNEELPESDSHNVYFPLSDDIFNPACVHLGVEDPSRYLPYQPHIQSVCNGLRWRHEYLENREKVKLFNDVLESTADGYWDWDIQSNQVYFSPRWKSMLGYSDSELENSFESWERLLHTSDHLQAVTRIATFHENPVQDYESEYRLRCKNGSYKWILSRGKVVEWVDGRVAKRIVGTHVDLSKQKQLEMHLVDANAKLNREQNLLVKTSEIARIGSWDVNVSDMEVHWSEMTAQIHEVDPGYMPDIERGIDFYKEGWNRERISKAFSRCIDEGVSFDEELIIITISGKEKWIRTVGIKDESDPGKIRIYGLFQDIDKSKRALDALKKSKQQQDVISQRLKLATNAGKIGVWDWNLVDEEIFLDDQMLQLYGIEEESGTIPYDILSQSLHPDDKDETLKEIEFALSGDKPFDCEHRIVRPDGTVRSVKSNGIVIRDESGRAIRMTGINFDITEQKNLEKEQKRARNSAEEANRSKSEFVATMSHEIRTPMNGVLGMLHLVLQSNIEDKTRKKLDIALNSAQSLLTIINDILDFSKIEAGKLTLEKTDFNPVEILENCISNSLALSQGKNVSLRVDLGGVSELLFTGDPVRFSQIVNNLLSNALKFTASGFVTLRASTTESLGKGNYILSCSVEDSGIGIPADKIDSLFSSFTQVDASTTRKFGGTGLGLAICRRLCELMGGSITVRSEEHVGSTFEFEIPVSIRETTGLTEPMLSFKEKRALIFVEDEFDRNVLLSYLKNRYKFVGVFSSQEAFLDAPRKPGEKDVEPQFVPATIVCDRLPSDALLKRLGVSPLEKSTNIIVVHTEDSEDVVPEIAGVQGLCKPILPRELFGAIEGQTVERHNRRSRSYFRGGVGAETKHDSAVKAGSLPAVDSSAPNGNKVLVVDDNQINQEVALGLLEEFNLGCDVAYNGVEALEKIKSANGEGYLLILMDCQMPEMNGYEATEKIRQGACGEKRIDVPIVAMTANAMAGDKNRCINAGMNDYLSKPLSPDLLRDVLDKWLFSSAEMSEKDSNTQPEIRETHVGKPDVGDFADSSADQDVSAQKEILVWDKGDALRRVRGKEDRLKKLVGMYISNNNEKMNEIKIAIDCMDYPMVAEYAHGLKGVSANLSCIHVNKLAAKLEKIAKNEESGLVEAWGELADATTTLIEVLSVFVSTE